MLPPSLGFVFRVGLTNRVDVAEHVESRSRYRHGIRGRRHFVDLRLCDARPTMRLVPCRTPRDRDPRPTTRAGLARHEPVDRSPGARWLRSRDCTVVTWTNARELRSRPCRTTLAASHSHPTASNTSTRRCASDPPDTTISPRRCRMRSPRESTRFRPLGRSERTGARDRPRASSARGAGDGDDGRATL